MPHADVSKGPEVDSKVRGMVYDTIHPGRDQYITRLQLSSSVGSPLRSTV